MLFNKILVFLSNSSDNDILAEEMGELTRFSRGLLVAVRPKIISRDFPAICICRRGFITL